MRNKTKSIKEVLSSNPLPDGLYVGLWSGYVIVVEYEKRSFEIQTVDGVKGINCKVVVEVKNNEITFEEVKS